MNQKTLKALKGSISKWKKVVKGTGYESGGATCALCQTVGCYYCPVMERTGESQCDSTPYRAWVEHHRACHSTEYMRGSRVLRCPICKVLAMKEVKFLESLLPVKSKSETKSVKRGKKGTK